MRQLIPEDHGWRTRTGHRLDMKRLPPFIALATLLALAATPGRVSGAQEGVAVAIVFDTSGSMQQPVKDSDGKVTPKYEYSNFEPVPGIYHCEVQSMSDLQKQFYYQFSKDTKNVYLFPMEWQDKILGVLSVDTYAKRPLRPFVVRNLVILAQLGAIALMSLDRESHEAAN